MANRRLEDDYNDMTKEERIARSLRNAANVRASEARMNKFARGEYTIKGENTHSRALQRNKQDQRNARRLVNARAQQGGYGNTGGSEYDEKARDLRKARSERVKQDYVNRKNREYEESARQTLGNEMKRRTLKK